MGYGTWLGGGARFAEDQQSWYGWAFIESSSGKRTDSSKKPAAHVQEACSNVDASHTLDAALR
jgi:hypothetical protein